jgi:hypothetical protein
MSGQPFMGIEPFYPGMVTSILFLPIVLRIHVNKTQS